MILVTGATGTVGREVVKLLSPKGIKARALVHSRGKRKLVDFPGIEVAFGDFDAPDTIEKALHGVDEAFFVMPLTSPTAETYVDWQKRFIDLARKAGVRHIVRLSVLGADKDSPIVLGKLHWRSDSYLIRSGITYTILRPHFFMHNFLGWLDTLRSDGAFYLPMKSGKISLIDVRDIAEVAVNALTGSGYENKIHDLTGPEALSFAELAGGLSKAAGKEIHYVDVTPEDARKALIGMGITDWYADAMVELMRDVFAKGYASDVSTSVCDLTGHDPRSWGEFSVDLAKCLDPEAVCELIAA
jgi:uncharacterized protein YbjT (DUF2867 family)